MREIGAGEFVVAAVAGVLGGFVFLAFTDFALLQADWCGPETRDCVREWINALSGWAATFAAAVTLIFLVRQTSEARRQTDFLVGNDLPTATLFDPRNTDITSAFANRLQITNWNRNPVLIKDIQVENLDGIVAVEIEVIDHDYVRRNQLQAEYDTGRMLIPGWANRSVGPTFAEFDVKVIGVPPAPDDPDDDYGIRKSVVFLINIIVAGENYTYATLRIDRPDARAFR